MVGLKENVTMWENKINQQLLYEKKKKDKKGQVKNRGNRATVVWLTARKVRILVFFVVDRQKVQNEWNS